MIDLFGVYASVVDGLAYGLVISLLAAGLSLVYGVMGNINMAHGTFYMFGAFVAYWIVTVLGGHTPIGIALAVPAVFAIGIAVLIVVVPRRMWVTLVSDELAMVMIMLLAFTTVASQIIFFIFGGTPINIPRAISIAILLPGRVNLDSELALSMVIAIATYALIGGFLGRTKFGKAIRAYSQDKESAEAIGISGRRTVLVTFGIGAALAALSGGLFASVYSVDSSTGLTELLIAFIIVLLGGAGSLLGSIVAGLIYGIIYESLQSFYPQYTFVVLFLLIYVVIVVRPRGLFGEAIERV